MGRIFGFLSIVVTMAIGLWLYSTQIRTMSGSPATTTPKAAAEAVGVKNDLISIANAERGYLASEGRYGTLDELVSGKYITITGRPPYTYEVETDSDGFRVTATRTTPGSPTQVSIDQTMDIQSSD